MLELRITLLAFIFLISGGVLSFVLTKISKEKNFKDLFKLFVALTIIFCLAEIIMSLILLVVFAINQTRFKIIEESINAMY